MLSLIMVPVVPASLLAAAPGAGPSMIIEGTLGAMPGRGPILETNLKTYTLAGQSPYILHVLEDKRLLNQKLELHGVMGPSGFIVSRVYAVRNGQLYKIQYYCQTCNITYVQPGHCYCCGQETKLQEIPVGKAAQ